MLSREVLEYGVYPEDNGVILVSSVLAINPPELTMTIVERVLALN